MRPIGGGRRCYRRCPICYPHGSGIRGGRAVFKKETRNELALADDEMSFLDVDDYEPDISIEEQQNYDEYRFGSMNDYWDDFLEYEMRDEYDSYD